MLQNWNRVFNMTILLALLSLTACQQGDSMITAANRPTEVDDPSEDIEEEYQEIAVEPGTSESPVENRFSLLAYETMASRYGFSSGTVLLESEFQVTRPSGEVSLTKGRCAAVKIGNFSFVTARHCLEVMGPDDFAYGGLAFHNLRWPSTNRIDWNITPGSISIASPELSVFLVKAMTPRIKIASALQVWGLVGLDLAVIYIDEQISGTTQTLCDSDAEIGELVYVTGFARTPSGYEYGWYPAKVQQVYAETVNSTYISGFSTKPETPGQCVSAGDSGAGVYRKLSRDSTSEKFCLLAINQSIGIMDPNNCRSSRHLSLRGHQDRSYDWTHVIDPKLSSSKVLGVYWSNDSW